MKRYFFASILNLLLCAWLPFPAHAGGQRSVTDLVGRSMTVPEQPRRVVALAPSITEIVYALQMEACLAGVTRFSDFPLPAQSLPKVGSYVKLDVERIAALKPDLCIAIRDGNPVASVEQLQTLRIPVFAVNPHDLQSVMQSILAIADLLGAERKARIIVEDMATRIQKVKQCTAKSAHRPRVFFQIGVSPIVSVGSGTFIDELITLAGGVNVAAGRDPYPRFSREQVIALAPDVIVISSMAREAIFEQVKNEWLAWPAIPAAANKAVFIAPTNIFDRPTPRLVDGLELMAQYIHPEIFEVRP